MDQRKAILYALAAVLLWSTVATAFKLALRYLTPLQLLTIAALTSLLTFTLILSVQQRWREVWQVGRNRIGFYALQGFINPAAYYWVLFAAYDQLPAQQAQAINYTWAITMSLLAVPFLHQKLTAKELFAMLLAYVGVFLIATGGNWDFAQTNWVGIGLALFSTLLWASYWLINTKNTDKPVPALFWCFAWGSGWLVIFNLMNMITDTESTYVNLSWQGIGAGIYVGLFEMGITFFLWLTAMRLATKTAQISTLIFLSPFISLILIYFILGETIQITTLVGLSLICVGLYRLRE
ncbi:EamA domain-containing membrane protein RarD [Pseudidiomarina maritima]|uniref:EamA domain-containing membrane protein RarD n=1 Tax=Pseudidiomarina maritima TaxID=519453 RepID=A0A1I6G4M1_9GAMM|nr:DMT family transporter [Pseudidiomarina maritima]SFR37144.1 EamA domain-containing membrane protein RarD [Pseudidiomarina maritima]